MQVIGIVQGRGMYLFSHILRLLARDRRRLTGVCVIYTLKKNQYCKAGTGERVVGFIFKGADFCIVQTFFFSKSSSCFDKTATFFV